MKIYKSIIGIIFFLLISSNVFAQEDAYKTYKANKRYKQDANKLEARIDSTLFLRKNQIDFSLGMYNNAYVNYVLLNYRRSLYVNSNINLDLGMNFSVGMQKNIFISYQNDFESAKYIVSPSLSAIYGKSDAIELDVGILYFNEEAKLNMSKINSRLWPYINVYYVHNFKRKPVFIKAGLSVPYYIHIALGVRI